jgi:SNF2 family DNA or RNA helicase
MTEPDDDFAFLFADEFKPDYSHMLENAKSHKAAEPAKKTQEEKHEIAKEAYGNAGIHSLAATIGDMPTVNDIYVQLTQDSSEYTPSASDKGYSNWYPAGDEEREFATDNELEELRLKLTGEFINPAEETLEEEIAEDVEDIVEGNIIESPVSTALEVQAIEGIVQEDKSTEESPLAVAVSELQRLKDMDINNEAQENAIRLKINETQRILDEMRNELTRVHEDRRNHKAKIREAETKVSEEAHMESERLKEEEIKAQRKHAMMGFNSHIADLNPEWKDYAFDHQWEGAATLALHESGLLADEMGLGKTLTAIMYADMVKAKKILVVTPNDTCSNFTMEFAMWAKHRFVWTLAGNTKQQRDAFMDMIIMPRVEADEDITLCVNYEQLYFDADYFDQLKAIGFDTVIIDEFHNANKQKSLLFQRLKQLRSSGVKRFLPMTGTFILNKPEDIWTALHIIDEEAFPTMGQFRDHYCEYDYYESKWVFRPGGERSLLIRLGGRIVKRTMAEAGIVLPEMHIHNVDLEFPQGTYEDQRSIMRQLADHSQIILDSDRKVSIVEQIALITRQRQCAVWPAGIQIKDPMTNEVVFSVGEEVQESIKIDWVEDKIKELRNGNKRIAVFSQFKTALAELERRLIVDGFRVVRYDGDTDKSTKLKVKRDFDRRHVDKTGSFEWDIVLCNFKTGGVGLNFTHITDMIMLDEEWNPGKNQQAYKRIQRIGQTEETNIWIPRLKGAIDGWMKALNDSKADLIHGFDSEVDLQKEFNDFLSTVKESV